MLGLLNKYSTTEMNCLPFLRICPEMRFNKTEDKKDKNEKMTNTEQRAQFCARSWEAWLGLWHDGRLASFFFLD